MDATFPAIQTKSAAMQVVRLPECELSQRFFFEAAHTLERATESEGSRRIHGHTYHAEVSVTGMPDHVTGMVIDLAHLRAQIARVRDTLDHRFLDEVPGLRPATLERLCVFIRDQLQEALPGLSRVAVEREATGDKCVLRCDASDAAPELRLT